MDYGECTSEVTTNSADLDLGRRPKLKSAEFSFVHSPLTRYLRFWSHDGSEHVCEVRSYGKVVYAYEKRSPHHPVSRCLSGMLLGAAPSPRKRARRRAVGPTRWLSIVHIHYRPMVVRKRSLGALGDVGTARRILVSSRIPGGERG